MRVTSKGQVTIPQRIREHMGIQANTDVNFEIRRGQVVLMKGKSNAKGPGRGQILVARMRKIARAQPPLGMTTDEYMKLVRGQ
jgi:AbrB family looped-hinge helix DNA binding protein